MPARSGFIDSVQQSRLSWLTGTAFPVAPVGTFLALYGGQLPNSDGTGGNEITSGGRPAVAFGAVVSDGQARWTRSNTGIVTFTVPAGAVAGMVIGFGLFAATTGGVVNYADQLPPFPYAPGQTISIAVGAIKLFSEPIPF